MSYGKDLLTRAVANAGSGYALSKATGLQESHISEALRDKRQVPASWVLVLARVAQVDPTEAFENWDFDRAEKKRLRQQSLPSAADGAAGTYTHSGKLAGGLPDPPMSASKSRAQIDTSTHRLKHAALALVAWLGLSGRADHPYALTSCAA